VPPRRRSKPRSNFHQALGEAIEALREEDELTLEGLAEQAAMRFQLVSDLERGVTDAKMSTLLRICDGFEIELSELTKRAEEIRDGKG
jgi:transcriptional regulator with XRE-family HTH domain